jgi:integrase
VLPLRIIKPGELDAIVAALPEERWRVLVELAIGTGLRWGELVGLRVGDLDVATGLLTVSRTVVQLRKRFHPDGGRFLVKQFPKSRHYRRVSVPVDVVRRVERHVVQEGLEVGDLLFPGPQRRVRRELAGGLPSAREMTEPNLAGRSYRHGTLSGYSLGQCRCVLCRQVYARYRATRRGVGKDRPPVIDHVGTVEERYVAREWFRQRVWQPAVAAAGITRRIRLHDLRHAHASWVLAGGADVQIVRERLGHASLRATERYLHTLPDTDDVALTALARTRSQAHPAPSHRRHHGRLRVTATRLRRSAAAVHS